MGQGLVLNHPQRPRDPDWKILAGFEPWESILKPRHFEWLRNYALRRIHDDGAFCWIRGFASRRAHSEARNQSVSEQRAVAVQRFFLGEQVAPRQITGVTGIGSRWSTGGRLDNSENWRGVEVIITSCPVPEEVRNQPEPAPLPDLRPSYEWYDFYIRFDTAIINAWVNSGMVGAAGGGMPTLPDSTGSEIASRVCPDYTWFLISAGAQRFDSPTQRDQLYDFYCRHMAPLYDPDVARHVEDLKTERNRFRGIVERREYGPGSDPGWVPEPFRRAVERTPGAERPRRHRPVD
jgi:hypothetical protein